MPMFDFENTPINEYTKLKANYDCGSTGVLTYYGDWARVTLTDGTMLECQSGTELNMFLTSTSTATVNGSTLNVNQVKGIEFGTQVTTLPESALTLQYWSSLQNINGFHEGITQIGANFMSGGSSPPTSPLIYNTVILPSTLTSVGNGFLSNAGKFVGTIVVNCPATVIGNSGNPKEFAVSSATAPAYTSGLKVTGKYATNFMTRFPNLNGTSWYRNLYNGNTLTNLGSALEKGNAEEMFPVGVELPDMWNGLENPLIVAQYLNTTNNETYGNNEGVILIRKYVEPELQKFGTNSDYSTSLIDNYLQTTYLDNCSTELKSVISDVTIPYRSTYLTRKWFIMSAAEVDAMTDPSPPFAYWKQVTGFSTPSTGVSDGRILRHRDGSVATLNWLRTRYDDATAYYIGSSGQVSYTSGQVTGSMGVLPACFIEGKVPVRLAVTFDANGGNPLSI